MLLQKKTSATGFTSTRKSQNIEGIPWPRDREQAGERGRERERTNTVDERPKTQRSTEKRDISEGVVFKTTTVKIVKEIKVGNRKEGREGYIFQ